MSFATFCVLALSISISAAAEALTGTNSEQLTIFLLVYHATVSVTKVGGFAFGKIITEL